MLADVDASLNETVVMVAKAGTGVELQTTLYKPDGAGPFPIVVINHGKSLGDPRQQTRYRPTVPVRYFLQRGYVVVVPMRQGFAGSGGRYEGARCDVEQNGRRQAADVKAALDHVAAQPYADRSRILVVGQSHGGWTSLAFGTFDYPGVKGLINFAGGLRQRECPGWEGRLADGAAKYGGESRVPSLWFYGDNDSYFSPATWRGMYARYSAAGGRARLVPVGAFGKDSHTLFTARAGLPVWQPQADGFLRELGLPAAPLPQYARHARGTDMAAPPASGFADIDDESRLPHVKAAGRAAYRSFLEQAPPRAFAIGPKGNWAWADGGDDPLRRALERCNTHGGGCSLYAVDSEVVWRPER